MSTNINTEKVQQSISTPSQATNEPSVRDLFLRLRSALHDVQEYVADEYCSEEDTAKLADLAQAKSLLSDMEEIAERAEGRATNLYAGKLQPRIFLGTWSEFFTFDPSVTTARYCCIPDEFKK